MIGGLSFKVAAVSLAANALFCWLWLDARDDVAAAVAECNTEKLTAINKRERAVRKELESIHADELAERDAQIAELDRHVNILLDQREFMAEAANRHQSTLMQLTVEHFDEDIPDSGACLSVFVLNRSLAGMLESESCAGSGDSKGDGDALHANTRGHDADQPHFSDITYGDALVLWDRDRRAAVSSNCQLNSIREISDEKAD